MISWADRAKSHFLHKPKNITPKTTETPLLGVLGAYFVGIDKKTEGVLGVLGVRSGDIDKKSHFQEDAENDPVQTLDLVLGAPAETHGLKTIVVAGRVLAIGNTPTSKPLYWHETPEWRKARDALHAHHFSCEWCIAAGRGNGSRCEAGEALNRLYEAQPGPDNWYVQ